MFWQTSCSGSIPLSDEAAAFATGRESDSQKLELWIVEFELFIVRALVRYMRAQGYEAYFFGTPYLLPITGMWWHDIYEVCTDPHSIVYRGIFGWCWCDRLPDPVSCLQY